MPHDTDTVGGYKLPLPQYHAGESGESLEEITELVTASGFQY